MNLLEAVQWFVGEANVKGKILEDIVAKVHEANNLAASPRVKLPSKSDARREREIDVLLEVSVGPYPFRIPIECKNWGETVGVEDIDAYEGKLNDIGLNVAGAIYVSAGGYESGAVSRAKDLGIVLLTVDGLSSDRLTQEVYAAVTGTVFVFPSVTRLSFESPHAGGQQVLLDRSGNLGGSMLDLLWKVWMEHKSLTLGEVAGSAPVPEGWGDFQNGSFADILKVDYRLHLEGHLLARKGAARKVILTEHEGAWPFLAHFEADFESPSGKFELQRVLSEEALSATLGTESALVSSLVRLKVPRIMFDGPFGRYPWLPDDALFQQLWEMHLEDPKGFAEGKSARRIEMGSDIGLLFEKPSESYLENLKNRLGATWDPILWTAFE